MKLAEVLSLSPLILNLVGALTQHPQSFERRTKVSILEKKSQDSSEIDPWDFFFNEIMKKINGSRRNQYGKISD